MLKGKGLYLFICLMILSFCMGCSEKSLLPKDLSLGASVYFGSCEQDNLLENGVEPIEWIVADIQNDNVLLVCKQIIATHEYNANDTSVTWENCTLRAWLNSTFLENSFSDAERKYIVTKSVETSSVHQKYRSSLTGSYVLTAEPLPACKTEDQLFILSTEEISTYFASEASTVSSPTASVILNSEGGFTWWTRTPGVVSGSQRIVDDAGSYASGGGLNTIEFGVRPAIWVVANK